MRVVEQAVADGVGLVGVADDGVPVTRGQLAGDERRGTFGAVLDDLGEVAPLRVARRLTPSFFSGRLLSSSSRTRMVRFSAPSSKKVWSRSRARIHRCARSTLVWTAALSRGFLGRAGTTTAP